MTQGFDEYEKSLNGFTPHYKDVYEDGAQSRQAEVDELRGLFNSVTGDDLEEINRLKSVIDGMVNEIDELQHRIEYLEKVNESIADELFCYRARHGKGGVR